MNVPAGTFAEIAEWDWVYTSACSYGGKLHHLAEIRNDADYDWFALGRSTCGIDGEWHIAGLLSRMGRDRCAHCCDRLGIARGVGSPKNDKGEVRAWVEQRVEAMRTSTDSASHDDRDGP